MNPIGTLESITSVFPAVSDEFVEEYLVAIDSVLKLADPQYFPAASEVLNKAAEAAQSPARRERLLKAAADVLARRPSTELTLAGQAERHQAALNKALATQPAADEPAFAGDDDPEEDEDDEQMDEAPPALPHLPVRHFFSELVVRVAQEITCCDGRTLQPGAVLKLMRTQEEVDGTFVLSPLTTRSIRLDPVRHAEIIENASNLWFQPVPAADCLQELCHCISQELAKAEEALDEDEDDDYEDALERIDTLRADVEACQDWLSEEPSRDKAPRTKSASLAAKIFGREHAATAWVRLLYAGVRV